MRRPSVRAPATGGLRPDRAARRSDATSTAPLPLSGVLDILALQRRVGNRAVVSWLTDATAGVVQRQPGDRVLPPRTRRWDGEPEVFRGRAVLVRTTSIEATSWAEVGPGPPRIRYRRTVELETIDGIRFYLDIRGTVDLAPGTRLPDDGGAALQLRGARVLSQRTTHADGADLVEISEYSPHTVTGQSFAFVANAVMPAYAMLSLSPEQQEAAILAYLATRARRPRPPTAEDGPGTIATVADIGTDFLPIVGELKDLYRAIEGTDPVTGRTLAWWERALSVLGAIPLIGKLSKGIRAGAKFLGRGLSWLRGRGAAMGAWFAEKLEKWRLSRKAKRLEQKGRQLGKGGTAARAGRIFVAENSTIIAVVDGQGRILSHSLPNISHEDLIARTYRDGVLPVGEYAVTIGKDNGAIYVQNSHNYRRGGGFPPQHIIDAIKAVVD